MVIMALLALACGVGAAALAAKAAMGFGADALRLPLTSMEDQNRAVLFAEMRKLGIAV